MYCSTSLPILAILGTLTAALTTTTTTTTEYIAKFDNLTSLPVAGLTVNVYDELYYQSFVVVKEQTAGVAAHSAPNAITHDPVGNTIIGQAALLTNYTGSRVESFDLKDAWFGCTTASGNSIILVKAMTCDLTVKGFIGSSLKAQKSFRFVDDGAALQGMVKATFGSAFSGLTSVTMLAVNGTSTFLTLLLDDVHYVVHSG